MSRVEEEAQQGMSKESMLPVYQKWDAVLVDPKTAHAEEVLQVKNLLDHDAIFQEAVCFVSLLSNEGDGPGVLIGAMALTRVHPLSKSLLARLCKVIPDSMMQQLDNSALPGVEINYHLYGVYLMLKAVINDPRIEHGTALMIQSPVSVGGNVESRLDGICSRLGMGTTFDASTNVYTSVRVIMHKREFDTLDVNEEEGDNKKAKVEIEDGDDDTSQEDESDSSSVESKEEEEKEAASPAAA